IPYKVNDFLNSLTDKEKEVLKKLVSNSLQYKTIQDALDKLKEMGETMGISPLLHEKAVQIHKYLQDKVNGLGTEARTFIEEVLESAREHHSELAAGNSFTPEEVKIKIVSGVDKFKALSYEAKADLEKQFPITASIFKNEKFRKRMEKALELDD
ncbi:hypothetical protein PMAYCL1PPCAC_10301, partial [Pristionchus mayeri]